MDLKTLSLQGNESSAVSDVLLQLENLSTDNNNIDTDNIPNNLLTFKTDLLIIDEDVNRVIVRITSEDIETLTPVLNDLGFETLGSSPENHLIEGYIAFNAISELETLAEQGLILGVVPVYRPVTSVGNTDSQADFVLEADRVRAALPTSYDGTGQTVAVFSDSFNVSGNGSEATDITTGDLPAGGVTVLQEGPSGSSDEGRAMLQLIHDLAPGANLVFSSVYYGQADFAQQIQNAADPTNGNANVLVDDIVYFAEPFFQDGLIAQAVDDVVTNDGVTYFASAGNRDDRAYESTTINFAPDSDAIFSGSFFDFDPSASVDTRQTITLNNNQSFKPSFQWDDPFFTVNGVDTNLDIFLVDSSNNIVASSADNNIASQTPVELLSFTNTSGSQQNYELLIQNISGPNPNRIKYVDFGGSDLTIEYDTNSPTVNPHAAATNAQAVAAIPFFNQDTPESFTSQGPSTFLFEPDGTPKAEPESRNTPDIAAIDGTDTTFFGQDLSSLDNNNFPNFFGTSAAAPHAAAVTALVQQAHPNLTPQQVYALLQSTAEDISPSGFDNVTGFGLINAYDAIFGLPVPATLPFVENFDDGDLPLAFETNTNGAGRIQVTSDFSPLGTQQLTLDGSTRGSFSLNEAILHVDTTGFTDIVLSFDQKEFGDEDNVMSATFVGSENSDGVALSVDGSNWVRLVDLTGTNSTSTFQPHTVDLTAIAAANSLTLGSDVQIKFQQYDNWPLASSGASDGFTFDNISITGTATINPTTGDDDLTSYATSGAENINGLAGNDTLAGGDGDDTLNGGNGDDLLNGDNDHDSLLGGNGNDTLNGGVGADIIFGGNDDDSLAGGDDNDTLNGGVGADILDGDNHDDSLIGSSGNDTLNGGLGTDILKGGNEHDSLNGGDGNDTLKGEVGADILNGDDHEDKLYGDDGNDTLNGGLGADIIFGGNDDDSLAGGDDNDTLNGGLGADILDGDNHDDSLIGNSGNDTLNGGLGADILKGGNEHDSLNGGDGNDTLKGEVGADILNGDAHEDKLYGDDGNDTLHGGLGADILFGGNDDDSLAGEDGNDTLNGGLGADILKGGNDDDELYGSNGDDTLIGGNGFDLLFGGLGSDRFSIESTTFANRNIIKDFEDGTDLLELAGDLTFGALTITQSGAHTKIVETATNEKIAVVRNIDAVDIDLNDFI